LNIHGKSEEEEEWTGGGTKPCAADAEMVDDAT
jgi:hypothetical protein